MAYGCCRQASSGRPRRRDAQASSSWTGSGGRDRARQSSSLVVQYRPVIAYVMSLPTWKSGRCSRRRHRLRAVDAPPRGPRSDAGRPAHGSSVLRCPCRVRSSPPSRRRHAPAGGSAAPPLSGHIRQVGLVPRPGAAAAPMPNRPIQDPRSVQSDSPYSPTSTEARTPPCRSRPLETGGRIASNTARAGRSAAREPIVRRDRASGSGRGRKDSGSSSSPSSGQLVQRPFPPPPQARAATGTPARRSSPAPSRRGSGGPQPVPPAAGGSDRGTRRWPPDGVHQEWRDPFQVAGLRLVTAGASNQSPGAGADRY